MAMRVACCRLAASLQPTRSRFTSANKLQRRGCSSSQNSTETNPLVRYLKSLKWVPIPLGVGFAYICYQQYGHVVKREEKLMKRMPAEDLVANEWQVRLYRALPLKVMSRLWGRMNSLDIPVALRESLLGLYAWAFGCNLDEAAVRDLSHYRNLGEFFKRRLRPSCRPVDKHYPLTSPSDGKVLHFGRVENGWVEQVKGITYPLSGFIGPTTWADISQNKGTDTHTRTAAVSPAAFERQLKREERNVLYHCVVYLAPGDYHGFHSPTAWTVNLRRHFPGDLLSVSPGIVRWVRGLFNLNERAVYLGQWQHGFFAMAAVGATNVGSIKIYHDQALETNMPVRYPDGCYLENNFSASGINGLPMDKGTPFGEFNLGSTIVLIFEAPESFEFRIEAGQKIKYGQPIGKCRNS